MKKMRGFFIIFIFFSSFMIFSFINYQINPSQNPLVSQTEIESKVSTSYSQQWLQKPTLISPIGPEWYSTSGGDISDVSALDGIGQANMTVIGDAGSQTILANPPSVSDWTAFNNPDFPVRPYADDGPGGNPGDGIDSSGMWASHTWDEDGAGGQLGQTPSVEWKRNVTTLVNMSDYEITAASLTAVVNGTVDLNVDCPGDTAHGGSGGAFSGAVYDYARYYVVLSTLQGTTEYEVAYFKTSTLGAGNPPGVSTMGNTYMITVPQNLLIFYLTTILSGDYHNFTIIIGILIYCEDNCALYELDTFTLLRINSFNLTFSYQKKIDKTSYVEWSQVGNRLPTTPGTLIVDSARLHFQYRIDQAWPSADSPNSEIRMLINNIQHSETVDLSTATGSYQDAKLGGFDVTPLIQKGVNITLAIQLYLADDFLRPIDITLSIDNVYLWINYTIILNEPSLSVSADVAYLITNQYTNITVTCSNGTGSIDTLWYYNPLDSQNHTLATDFFGTQVHHIINTTGTDGAYRYKFWANSSIGLESYKELIIIWIKPILPSLSVTANATNIFTNQWTNLTVTCANGTGRVDSLWYYNPLDMSNHSLATNFTGQLVFNILNSTATAGPYTYRFWANSTLGNIAYDDITVVWNTPQSPILNVVANATSPYINQWTEIIVTCQSGSANVSRLWYYNPLSSQNITLATNFEGIQVFNILNTTAIAGPYTYRFWANSTLGPDAYKDLFVVWVTPQSPTVTLLADKTDPYTNREVQITVTCQSGSGSVSMLWYNNPFDLNNYTLDTNFIGIRVHYLNFTSPVAGVREFKFWANSSLGLKIYQSITIIWVDPQAPIITVSADITNPYINQFTNLTVTCQSGSGNVSMLWYYDPLDLNNHTLDTNFVGSRVYYLNFTSPSAGAREFKFWANSSLGLETRVSMTIVWIEPTLPILTVNADITTPYVNYPTQLTVSCQSGTGNVSMLWYYDPLDLNNHTLDTNFSGSRVHYLNFTSPSAGAREFKFWANSSIGLEVYRAVTIVWIQPTPPIITINADTTTPYVDQEVLLTVTCQSGIGNVSVLWYEDPFDLNNYTIDTNFAGVRVHYLNFTSSITGPREFKFWANSTFGLETDETLTIFWIVSQPPLITVIADITTPYINYYTQLTVTGQSGTDNISVIWYYNPLDIQNHTLDTNFEGTRTYYLNFTTGSGGSYKFEFWANSTLGLSNYQSINIVWIQPQAPILTVSANTTTPYTNDWTKLIVSAQSGSGNISMLWYYDPFDLTNHTLDSNFEGNKNYYQNFTSATRGAFQFKFWANSSFGLTTPASINIIWIDPQPPILALTANATVLEINQWSQINVTCQSGSFNISRLWYYDALNWNNFTLDNNFTGLRTYSINFMSATGGAYQFRFWANSTYNLQVSTFVTVLWVTPQPPSLTVSATNTNPYTNYPTTITVQCQSGSDNVDTLWYYNPLHDRNETLAQDFAGIQTHTIINTSAIAGPYTYQFWANSTQSGVTESLLIVWSNPTPPMINAFADISTLYLTEWTNITMTCQSGSENVDTWWYYNPISGKNITLGINFAGFQTQNVVNTSYVENPQLYTIWANDTLGTEVSDDITIVWLTPSAPTLRATVSDNNPVEGESTQITVVCRSGTGNVTQLWYNDPFTGRNKTIKSNFVGEYTEVLYFTSEEPGEYTFEVWANSSYGVEAYDFSVIVWSEKPGISPIVWGLIAALGAVAAIALLWQLYFRVPKTIRTIRKTKSAIKKGKPTTPLKVTPREKFVDDTFNKIIKMKKLPTKKPEAPGVKVIKKIDV